MSESQKAAIAEGDGPFKELEEEIKNLHSIELDLVSENTDVAQRTWMQLPLPMFMQKF